MDYDLKLINEVRQHPQLYDSSQLYFKNRDVKQVIWGKIAYNLRQECDEQAVRMVKVRWKSLRDSYVKEVKYLNALNSGQYIKPKRNWRFTTHMSFLEPFVTFPNVTTGKHKMTPCDKIEPVENFFVTREDLKDSSDEARETTAHDELVYLSDQELLSPSESFPQNEIDSFFKGIAETVKKLSPVNQVRVQRDIVNMVLDAKLYEVKDTDDRDPLDLE